MSNWLDDFLEYTSSSETPSKIMWWIGVSTIAGALQRKVWIEETVFQWTPNFYILIVAPPNTIHKSSSVRMGMKLLEEVPGVDFGPQATTWQQLITHMAGCTKTEEMAGGKLFSHSSCTIEVSEFGSFFDPADRNMVDSLTDLWDSKLHVYRKETKTNGNDEVVNPWINMIACTTPKWMEKHFPEDLVGQGFGSRVVFLYADKAKKAIAYPSKELGKSGSTDLRKADLVRRLQDIALLSGEFKMTPEAYIWGTTWYAEYLEKQLVLGDTVEAGFKGRWQTHLHKLAMIISVSKGNFPWIDVEDLEEANLKLLEIEEDANIVFSSVGKVPEVRIAETIISLVKGSKGIGKSALFKKGFSNKIKFETFEVALKSALATGENEGVLRPMVN
jgi:hypothetical protein